MARAKGNDLAEIFGYAPDDTSEPARKQWKSRKCPFVGNTCIKHSHPRGGGVVEVYGTCSVHNKTRNIDEEVIACAQRLYAGHYFALKGVVRDATGVALPTYTADEYSQRKQSKRLPNDYVVMLGQNSGSEVKLDNNDAVKLNLDWVFARITDQRLASIIPCEVQSIDTTGNYSANWEAYRDELPQIPDSNHGMNWANVWKRLIPQLILKGAVASTSNLCHLGHYFIVPDRVYLQFEKLVGGVPQASAAW